MMRFRHVTLALAMVALTGSLAWQHRPPGPARSRPAPPPEPKNLQVLPKTMTTAQILPIMRNFSAALGTNCGYCHVWTGPGLPTNDYAADTSRPRKSRARHDADGHRVQRRSSRPTSRSRPISSRASSA